jgi:hypothetical protein
MIHIIYVLETHNSRCKAVWIWKKERERESTVYYNEKFRKTIAKPPKRNY